MFACVRAKAVFWRDNAMAQNNTLTFPAPQTATRLLVF